jgi:hypothetical protein
MTRADWLLLVAVIGSLPLLYSRFWFQDENARYLQAQEGNQPARIIPLDRDSEVLLEGPLGTSTVEIRAGRARFLHSSCPGKQCIQAGWLTTSGELAACLPNRISIQLLGTHPRFDAINF